MSAQQHTEQTYALYAQAYLDAGWPCVLPVPPETKSPPPEGFTGADGADTTPADVARWAATRPGASIALRLPDGVIGIDVDHYPKGQTLKVGGETLAALEAQLGPLPPTWISSARAAPSGIRFYRVPPGRYATKLTATQPDGRQTGDIEVIQRHHRYAVVAPSHHEVGGAYAWHQGSSAIGRSVPLEPGWLPSPAALPELPPAWVEHLRGGATVAGPAAAPRDDGDALLAALWSDGSPPCVAMLDAITRAEAALSGTTAGTRHDVAIERVHHVVHLAAAGHPGAVQAHTRMTGLWADLTAGEDREEEWARMWTTSARKAVTANGDMTPRQHVVVQGFSGPDCRGDAAELAGLFGVHASVQPQYPGQPLPGFDPLQQLATPQISPYQDTQPTTPVGEVDSTPDLAGYLATYGLPANRLTQLLGTTPFDPQVSPVNEQAIAAAVLERAWPGLRWATDARKWYVRMPDGTWDIEEDGQRGMVSWLTELMPTGDAQAEKGTPAQLQAARRARLRTSAGDRAVASKMTSLISGPDHPSRIQAAQLDTRPATLWAGTVPWNLARCRNGLAPAELDWRTPHLRDTGVLPQLIPTPAWDAFCRAVWPEDDLREWALRVLSIAFTGYADAAMPVLLGDSGRGKSSMAALLCSLLGGYGKVIHSAILSATGDGARFLLGDLQGIRLALFDESPFDSPGRTEKLKQITGGVAVTADVKGGRSITFEPSHTVVITSNHEIGLSDPALIRRYRPLECRGDPEEVLRTRVALAEGAWQAEKPGILAAMMMRAGAWLADRASTELSAMPAIAARVMEQAAEDDLVGSWLTDCTTYDEHGTPSRQLFANFEQWYRGGGYPAHGMLTETKWGRELTKRQLPVIKRPDANYRPLVVKGLRLVGGSVGTPRAGTVGGFWNQSPAATVPNSPPAQPPMDETVHDPEPSTKPTTLQNPSSTPTTVDTLDSFDSSSSRREDNREGGIEGDNIGQGYERVEGERVMDPQPPNLSTPEPGEPVFTQPDIPGVNATCPAISGPIAFDLETHSGDALYTTGPGFVRLGVVHDASAVASPGRPQLTNDWRGLVEQLHGAADDSANAPEQPWSITGHNLFGFDYQVLARYAGLDLARVADATFDTLLAARYLDPPMARDKGVDATRKYDLDSVGEKFGLGGKQQGGLAPIAKRHPCDIAGHPGKTRAMPCAGAIPLDDPDYQAYTERDAVLQTDVAHALSPAMQQPYLRREHRVAAIAAQMSLNGLCVDTQLLNRRLDEGADRKELALQKLNSQYGIPIIDARGRRTASPLATNDGKAALMSALLALDVPPAAIPRTDKTNLITVGGDGMRALAQTYPQARELCELVAGVTGERTIYQTVQKHLVTDSDGNVRVHPKIGFDQATGRWSLTRPGMTVFGKRGERWHEREVILPDPGHVIISIDLSQVDMRAIAALSGDSAYIAMFAPGRDAHTEIAGLLGLEREPAKSMGHGWNYGLGVNAMIRDGIPEHLARQFDAGMNARFPRLIAWRETTREWARSGQLMDNGWGRPMRPNPDRAYTQGPALMGQGAARDIGMEGLLRLPTQLWPYLRAFVHDEIVLSVPAAYARDVEQIVIKAMSFEWAPAGIPVPIVAAGQTWTVDGQQMPAHGRSWGHVYSKVG